jgi:dephospho-CoA kinase
VENGATKVTAITGGIASGKSTVGGIVEKKGHLVIDVDRIARDLTCPGCEATREIVSLLGEDIVLPDGALDRRKIAEIVFSDPQKLRELEAVLHPRINAEWIRRVKESGREWAFVIIPLLFETGMNDTVDSIWLCYAPVKVRTARAMARDITGRDDVIARMKHQMPDEKKKPLVDVVIDTSGTLEDIERQVDLALSAL